MFRKSSDRTLSHDGKPMSAACIETEMRAALPRVLEGITPKAIARRLRQERIEVTEYAAKGWKRGNHLPQAHIMVALERAYPGLAAEMRRIRDLPGDNPEEVVALGKLFLAEIRARRGHP